MCVDSKAIFSEKYIGKHFGRCGLLGFMTTGYRGKFVPKYYKGIT